MGGILSWLQQQYYRSSTRPSCHSTDSSSQKATPPCRGFYVEVAKFIMQECCGDDFLPFCDFREPQWALLSWSWRNRTGLGWWTVIVWRCRSIKAWKGKAGCRQLAMDQWAPLSLADVCRVLIYFPDSPDHKFYTKGFSDHRGHTGVSCHVANIVVFQFLAPTHSARCSFLSWLLAAGIPLVPKDFALISSVSTFTVGCAFQDESRDPPERFKIHLVGHNQHFYFILFFCTKK